MKCTVYMWRRSSTGKGSFGTRNKEAIIEKVDRALDMVQMRAYRERGASQLSGGQQQRVALARAFVVRPQVLLADEPTGSLDFATGETVMQLMFDLNREIGTTLVLVTHDTSIAARCDRQLHIEAGRLLDEVPA